MPPSRPVTPQSRPSTPTGQSQSYAHRLHDAYAASDQINRERNHGAGGLQSHRQNAAEFTTRQVRAPGPNGAKTYYAPTPDYRARLSASYASSDEINRARNGGKGGLQGHRQNKAVFLERRVLPPGWNGAKTYYAPTGSFLIEQRALPAGQEVNAPLPTRPASPARAASPARPMSPAKASPARPMSPAKVASPARPAGLVARAEVNRRPSPPPPFRGGVMTPPPDWNRTKWESPLRAMTPPAYLDGRRPVFDVSPRKQAPPAPDDMKGPLAGAFESPAGGQTARRELERIAARPLRAMPDSTPPTGMYSVPVNHHQTEAYYMQRLGTRLFQALVLMARNHFQLTPDPRLGAAMMQSASRYLVHCAQVARQAPSMAQREAERVMRTNIKERIAAALMLAHKRHGDSDFDLPSYASLFNVDALSMHSCERRILNGLQHVLGTPRAA